LRTAYDQWWRDVLPHFTNEYACSRMHRVH
jgi:hypothetical protein